jgi:hypothetical protein
VGVLKAKRRWSGVSLSPSGISHVRKEILVMHCQLGSLILWAALSGAPAGESSIYADYKEAYLAGKAAGRPVLVIINPGTDADAQAVEVDMLKRSAVRRELLENYVVAVIDASTPEGQKVHKLFDSPPLPRVSVIDKEQKWQIYRTSKPLNAEDWNIVLEKYRTGQAPAPAAKPTCNCMLNAAR